MLDKGLPQGGRHALGRSRTDAERHAGASLVDLTPMIDVTILLLIFFMVTAVITKQEQVDLPEARHGLGIDPEFATSIVVLKTRDPSDAPTVALEDGGTTVTLDEVRAAVERGLSENRTHVAVKAHRQARWGDVSKVARVVAEVEGVDLFIGVREKD